MVDYSNLSDFEINKRIALALGFDLYKDGKSCQKNHVAIQEGRSGAFAMDWCNNPADAWPIISDNRISLMYDKSTEEGNDAQWCLASSPCDKYIVDYVSESKLLRAAMIVFLMMQDEKHG